ncbi:MAG: hypothetical protein HY013_07440 [Candidatus Solibacter usitatus]|nr:hypothetical protein [Candidatus Solibacter usitatus]
MRLKSYYAGTVEAAMSLARQELGEEALLMNSRPAPPEARHLGLHEVVFAVERDPPPAIDGRALAAELAQLRRQLHRMSARWRRINRFDPWLEEVADELAAAGLDDELIAAIAGKLQPHPLAGDPDRTQQMLAQELAACFGVEPSLESPAAAPSIVALLGPPGAGKTTLLVKLAARYGLPTRRPTHLLSLDTQRIAAADQLRCYAAILGVGFEAFESANALAQGLARYSQKELILIDTPGYSPGDLDLDLAHYLADHREIDKHLVLSCSTKSSDLSNMADRFAVFQPSKLIFTHLDETERYGGILNQASRTRWPVSFLSSGPRIPEDLEPATRERIIQLVLRGERGALERAATA